MEKTTTKTNSSIFLHCVCAQFLANSNLVKEEVTRFLLIAYLQRRNFVFCPKDETLSLCVETLVLVVCEGVMEAQEPSAFLTEVLEQKQYSFHHRFIL